MESNSSWRKTIDWDSILQGASESEVTALIQKTFLNKHVDGWAAQQHNGPHRESMTQIGG